MNTDTPVRSGYVDPRANYRNMRADLALLRDQLQALVDTSSVDEGVAHRVTQALHAITDHEQKFPKNFVEAPETAELSLEDGVKYNIARDLVRELNRQCIFLLHASGMVVGEAMMQKYHVVFFEESKLRGILSEREQREAEFKWRIHTSIEKIEKYIRSHVGEGDKNNEKIQWEISSDMQEWYRDVYMAVRFGLLEHGSSMWIRGHHIVKSWEEHETGPLKNALLNNIVSSFEFELTKKRTEDQLANPNEGKLFWRDHRWFVGGTAMGSVSGFVIGTVFLGEHKTQSPVDKISAPMPKKKQKKLSKKIQKKQKNFSTVSPDPLQVVPDSADTLVDDMQVMTSEEDEVVDLADIEVVDKENEMETKIPIISEQKVTPSSNSPRTSVAKSDKEDAPQRVVVQRPRVYVVFMNPVRKGEDILSVVNRVVERSVDQAQVPTFADMSTEDIEQWKKDELQTLGFVYHNGQWGYPFTAHAGTEVELYVDEDGKPHLRIVGEDGKTISMHERVAFREPSYDEQTDIQVHETIRSDIEVLVDEIRASVLPDATSEVRALLDKRLAEQVGRPVPPIEDADMVYDGRAVELRLEGGKRLVVYPERITTAMNTNIKWRLKPVVWKLVESDIPVGEVRGVVSPDEARESREDAIV